MTTSTHPSSEDLRELEALAITVAAEAGRFIVEERPREAAAMGIETKSSDVDLVTVMDRRSQRLIAERVRAARPQDAFLGEEEHEEAAARPGQLTWVVDPIDGTVNYAYDYPLYAVSVAVVEGTPHVPGEWRPLAGAVVHAGPGTIFHARRDGGAYRRDGEQVTRLATTRADDLSRTLVATGFGYDAAKRRRQGRVLVEVLPHVGNVRRGGSAALDLCHVASGQLDGYFEMGINPWDMAAGWLVLTEAGGMLSGAHGAPPSSDSVIASGPGIHAAFVRLVEDALTVW